MIRKNPDSWIQNSILNYSVVDLDSHFGGLLDSDSVGQLYFFTILKLEVYDEKWIKMTEKLKGETYNVNVKIVDSKSTTLYSSVFRSK